MPPPQQLLSSSVSFKCLKSNLKVYPIVLVLLVAFLPLSVPQPGSSEQYFNSTKVCLERQEWPDSNFCYAVKSSSLLNERAQQQLTKLQKIGVDMFCDMVRILKKVDCKQPYSVHVERNQCTQCQDAYRDWVCSVLVELVLEDKSGEDVIKRGRSQAGGATSPIPFRSCDSICNHVLRVCPYLSPDRVQVGPSGNASLQPSQYGGHPAFFCPSRPSLISELRQRIEERQGQGAYDYLIIAGDDKNLEAAAAAAGGVTSSTSAAAATSSVPSKASSSSFSTSTSSTSSSSTSFWQSWWPSASGGEPDSFDQSSSNSNPYNGEEPRRNDGSHNNNDSPTTNNNLNNNLSNGFSVSFEYYFRRASQVNLTDQLLQSNESACCWTYNQALISERRASGVISWDDDETQDYTNDTFPLSLLVNPKNYVQIMCVKATVRYTPPQVPEQEEPEGEENSWRTLVEDEQARTRGRGVLGRGFEDGEEEGEEEGGSDIDDDVGGTSYQNAQQGDSFDGRTLSKFIIDFDTEPGVGDVYDYVELADGASLPLVSNSNNNNNVNNNDDEDDNDNSRMAHGEITNNNNFTDDDDDKEPTLLLDKNAGSQASSVPALPTSDIVEMAPLEQPQSGQQQISKHRKGRNRQDIVHLDSSSSSSRSSDLNPEKLATSSSKHSSGPLSDRHHHHHGDKTSSSKSAQSKSSSYFAKDDTTEWFEKADDNNEVIETTSFLDDHAKSTIQKRNNYLSIDDTGAAAAKSTKNGQKQQESPSTSTTATAPPAQSHNNQPRSQVTSEAFPMDEYTNQLEEQVHVYHHHHHHRSASKNNNEKQHSEGGAKHGHQRHSRGGSADTNNNNNGATIGRSERSTSNAWRKSNAGLVPEDANWILMDPSEASSSAKSSANPTVSMPLGWILLDSQESTPKHSVLPPLVVLSCLAYSLTLIMKMVLGELDSWLRSALFWFWHSNVLVVVKCLKIVQKCGGKAPTFVAGLDDEFRVCWPAVGKHWKSVPIIPRLLLSPDHDEERRWDKIQRGKRLMTSPSALSLKSRFKHPSQLVVQVLLFFLLLIRRRLCRHFIIIPRNNNSQIYNNCRPSNNSPRSKPTNSFHCCCCWWLADECCCSCYYYYFGGSQGSPMRRYQILCTSLLFTRTTGNHKSLSVSSWSSYANTLASGSTTKTYARSPLEPLLFPGKTLICATSKVSFLLLYLLLLLLYCLLLPRLGFENPPNLDSRSNNNLLSVVFISSANSPNSRTLQQKVLVKRLVPSPRVLWMTNNNNNNLPLCQTTFLRGQQQQQRVLVLLVSHKPLLLLFDGNFYLGAFPANCNDSSRCFKRRKAASTTTSTTTTTNKPGQPTQRFNSHLHTKLVELTKLLLLGNRTCILYLSSMVPPVVGFLYIFTVFGPHFGSLLLLLLLLNFLFFSSCLLYSCKAKSWPPKTFYGQPLACVSKPNNNCYSDNASLTTLSKLRHQRLELDKIEFFSSSISFTPPPSSSLPASKILSEKNKNYTAILTAATSGLSLLDSIDKFFSISPTRLLLTTTPPPPLLVPSKFALSKSHCHNYYFSSAKKYVT